MCAWRHARVFLRDPVLVSTPGLSLFMNFEEEENMVSCQDMDGAGR